MRLLREYFLKNPPTGLREAFDQIIAAEHAAQGREPPLPRKQFSVDQETQSFQQCFKKRFKTTFNLD